MHKFQEKQALSTKKKKEIPVENVAFSQKKKILQDSSNEPNDEV